MELILFTTKQLIRPGLKSYPQYAIKQQRLTNKYYAKAKLINEKMTSRDIKGRAYLSMFLAPNNIISEILPLSCFNIQNSEVSGNNCLRAHLNDIANKRNWQYEGGDVAVWLLVSSATVSEFQKDLKETKPNRRWKLALLAKNSLFLGPVLDHRCMSVVLQFDSRSRSHLGLN
jgi:hypothetical protein